MRSEFEKLPEIQERLHIVVFNEQFNNYHAAKVNSGLSVHYVRGAWYAYQEQQKKIDDAMIEISRALGCCKSIETECVLVEIKELLK